MSTRVFLIRHGETHSFPTGRHLSRTELSMTKEGNETVQNMRRIFVGEDKLIKPEKVVRIYCSPRERSRATAAALGLGIQCHQLFRDRDSGSEFAIQTRPEQENDGKVIEVTPWLAEWDFGDFEGLTLFEIRDRIAKDKAAGKEMAYGPKDWNIWEHGCPNGESPDQVTRRVDALINEIRQIVEKAYVDWPSGQRGTHIHDLPNDVVCVGHGHILSALAMRWVNKPLQHGMKMLMEPGGVGILA